MAGETIYKNTYMENNLITHSNNKGETFGFTADYLFAALDTKTLESFYVGLKGSHISVSMLKNFNGSELIQNYIGAEMIRSKNLLDWETIYNMDKRTLFKSCIKVGALCYTRNRQSQDLQSSLNMAITESRVNSLTDKLYNRIDKIRVQDFQKFKSSVMRRAAPIKVKMMTREEYSDEIIRLLQESSLV